MCKNHASTTALNVTTLVDGALGHIAAVIIGGTRLGGGEGSILGTLLGVLLIGVVRDGLWPAAGFVDRQLS